MVYHSASNSGGHEKSYQSQINQEFTKPNRIRNNHRTKNSKVSQDPPGIICSEESKYATPVNSNQTPSSRIRIRKTEISSSLTQPDIIPQNIKQVSTSKTFKTDNIFRGKASTRDSAQGVINRVHSTLMHDMQTTTTNNKI